MAFQPHFVCFLATFCVLQLQETEAQMSRDAFITLNAEDDVITSSITDPSTPLLSPSLAIKGIVGLLKTTKPD